MSSHELYLAIGEKNRPFLDANEPIVDEFVLDPSRDSRMGISLILPVRLDGATYRDLVQSMSLIEPDQYYYPPGDLHTTIFDFVSARAGFASNPDLDVAFLDIASRACAAMKPFELRFEGVVCSREAGLIAGYDGNALVELRSRIRQELIEAGLKNDERYNSPSAHCCFMRFAARLRMPRRFLETIGSWDKVSFGASTYGAAELVEHDWYNRRASLRKIGICVLGTDGKGGAKTEWLKR